MRPDPLDEPDANGPGSQTSALHGKQHSSGRRLLFAQRRSAYYSRSPAASRAFYLTSVKSRMITKTLCVEWTMIFIQALWKRREEYARAGVSKTSAEGMDHGWCRW